MIRDVQKRGLLVGCGRSADMAENGSVPFWWIVVFLLLALGAGIGSVFLTGGSIFIALPGLLL